MLPRSSNGSNFASTDVGLKASNPRVFFGWMTGEDQLLLDVMLEFSFFITVFVKDGFESLLLDVMTTGFVSFYWIYVGMSLCRLRAVKVIYH